MTKNHALLAAAILGLGASAASAQMRITEYQYNGSEFVELTNVGTASVDMSSGWSFDDNSRVPHSYDFSFATPILPGESVIISEATAAAFRTTWGLPSTVKVAGGVANGNNLGNGDEINIYNGNTLVDRLTYGDQTANIRTDVKSGWTAPANFGANNISQWSLSDANDGYRGRLSSSPTTFTASPATEVQRLADNAPSGATNHGTATVNGNPATNSYVIGEVDTPNTAAGKKGFIAVNGDLAGEGALADSPIFVLLDINGDGNSAAADVSLKNHLNALTRSYQAYTIADDADGVLAAYQNDVLGDYDIVLKFPTGRVPDGDGTFYFDYDFTAAAITSMGVNSLNYVGVVPEPGTLSLLALGSLGILRRRRRTA